MFTLRIAGSGPVPSGSDLAFRLVNSTGDPLTHPFLVLLSAPGIGSVSTWNSSLQFWAAANSSEPCFGTACPDSPLVTGDTLLVRTEGPVGFPIGLHGEQLVVLAVGGGFTGSVSYAVQGPS